MGGLVETFAANEIAKQLTWDDTGARLHHFRDRDGPEVDLILERPDGRIVAIEVKAAISPGIGAFRWLTWLRDRLDRIGNDFVHGFVLHTGPNRLSFGDRLTLLPLDALWTPKVHHAKVAEQQPTPGALDVGSDPAPTRRGSDELEQIGGIDTRLGVEVPRPNPHAVSLRSGSNSRIG